MRSWHSPIPSTRSSVDEDVDIHDPTQVEWARTFRVQADKDVIIIAGAQAKHVDPSVRPWISRTASCR